MLEHLYFLFFLIMKNVEYLKKEKTTTKTKT